MTHKALEEAIIGEVKKQLPGSNDSHLLMVKHAIKLLFSSTPDGLSPRKKLIGELSKVKKSCEQLEDTLKSISPETISTIATMFNINTGAVLFKHIYNYDQLFVQFHKLSNLISAYLDAVKGSKARRGPRENLGLKFFIVILAFMYEVTTGNEAKNGITADHNHNNFQGPFFKLVKESLVAGEVSFQSDNALGERIRSVLSNRDKISEMLFAKPNPISPDPIIIRNTSCEDN